MLNRGYDDARGALDPSSLVSDRTLRRQAATSGWHLIGDEIEQASHDAVAATYRLRLSACRDRSLADNRIARN